MRAISAGCGAPMRSKATPARRWMKGIRPSFLRSTSVTLTPVLPARPVRPLLWMYVSGSCMQTSIPLSPPLPQTLTGQPAEEGSRKELENNLNTNRHAMMVLQDSVQRGLEHEGKHGGTACHEASTATLIFQGIFLGFRISAHLWRLDLDDQLDAGDVQAARRDVGRDQDVKLGVAERLQRALHARTMHGVSEEAEVNV